jgi:ribonucleoside-diphosphate reductase alpha chain
MTNKLSLGSNAHIVLDTLFLKKNEQGKALETPEQLFRKISKLVASSEIKYKQRTKIDKLLKKNKKNSYDFWWLVSKAKDIQPLLRNDEDVRKAEDEFFELLTSLDFLPNSTALMNSRKKSPKFASCFILPIEDDLGSIFSAIHKSALIQQTGAGTGFSLSKLRPHGDFVQNTPGAASGALSFMRVIDTSSAELREGSGRKCTNMVTLSIDHPEIFEFITAKQFDSINNTNIAVNITDRFFQAVEKGTNYSITNPRTGKPVRKEDARATLQFLCEQVITKSDPSLLFTDTINKHNPTPKLGRLDSTSPCGEIPLLSNEACSMGSINLSNMVIDGQVDWELLRKRVGQAVHFLDNLIDVTDYMFPEVFENVYGNRKLGLGVMGFADFLFKLRIRYNSDKALHIAEEVMKTVSSEAKKASAELAKKRGVFPNFRKSVYNSRKKEDRVRNAARTAIAPAVTISMIANCTPGIESLFAIIYKQQLRSMQLPITNSVFIQATKEEEVYSQKLMDQIAQKGSCKGLFIPVWMKRLFVTSSEISAEWHLRMQAAFQKYTDNAVAKTIFLPRNATVDDLMQLVKQSHELKCKGMTISREGTERKQSLYFGTQQTFVG